MNKMNIMNMYFRLCYENTQLLLKWIVRLTPKWIQSANLTLGELKVVVFPQFVRQFLQFLNSHINLNTRQLMELSAVDLSSCAWSEKDRFRLVYCVASLHHNFRIRVYTNTDALTPIPSVIQVFPNASWLEREVWDMFGVFFAQHPDLRRILTDYGFSGHPLRKDFPLTGYLELRYDDTQKRVISESIQLAQEFRFFDFSTPWGGRNKIGQHGSFAPAFPRRQFTVVPFVKSNGDGNKPIDESVITKPLNPSATPMTTQVRFKKTKSNLTNETLAPPNKANQEKANQHKANIDKANRANSKVESKSEQASKKRAEDVVTIKSFLQAYVTCSNPKYFDFLSQQLVSWAEGGMVKTLIFVGESQTQQKKLINQISEPLKLRVFRCTRTKQLENLTARHNAVFFGPHIFENMEEEQQERILDTRNHVLIKTETGQVQKRKGLIQIASINSRTRDQMEILLEKKTLKRSTLFVPIFFKII